MYSGPWGCRPRLFSPAPSGRKRRLLLRKHLQPHVLVPHLLAPAGVELQPEDTPTRQLLVVLPVAADVPVDRQPHVTVHRLDHVLVPLVLLDILLAAGVLQDGPAVLLVQLAPP